MKGGNLNLEQANHDATKVSVIGEMNHRIRLYQNKYVRDTAHPYNSQSKKIFLAEVWANVSNLSGNEYYAAAMVRVQKEVSMTFRYVDGLTESCEIWFNNRWYNIQFIDDVKYQHRYIQCKVAIETSTTPPDDLKGGTT
nr:MAG TPA: head tail joining protein [Caudoviricetes sp.]